VGVYEKCIINSQKWHTYSCMKTPIRVTVLPFLESRDHALYPASVTGFTLHITKVSYFRGRDAHPWVSHLHTHPLSHTLSTRLTRLRTCARCLVIFRVWWPLDITYTSFSTPVPLLNKSTLIFHCIFFFYPPSKFHQHSTQIQNRDECLSFLLRLHHTNKRSAHTIFR